MGLIRYFGLLAISIGLFSKPASAAPIHPKGAIDIAQNFFSGSLRSLTSEQDLRITYVAPEFRGQDEFRSASAPEGSTGLYYVINRGEGKGFVIVAGDDRVSPILAYSEEGAISNLDLVENYNLRYVLGSYTRQMRHAVLTLPDRPNETLRAGANIPSQEIVVEPLLRYSSDRRTRLPQPIAWGQDWPFNNYAPNITINGYSYPTVAGCVATAISTVMRWHRWPHHPRGTVGYNWRGYYLSAKLDGTSYNWNQMPARISGNGVNYETGYRCTNENADNVGRLLRDVAYAVQMSYDAAFRGGSGAYTENIIGPFARNFGYKRQVRYLYRSNHTAQTWWGEVTHELKNYGPVIYVGYGGGGGHCFVLDGYARLSRDYNYFVHVDWGWTGSQNGWYKIDVMEPGSLGIGGGTGGGFASHQAMVRYLEPDPNWEDGISPNPRPRPEPQPEPSDDTYAYTLRVKSVAKASVEEGGKILIPTRLYNEGKGKFDALLKVYAVREGVDPLTQSQEIDKGQISIARSSSLKINLELDLNQIEPKLVAGKYNIYLAYPSKDGYYIYVRDTKGTPAVCANLTVTKKGQPEPKPEPKPIIESKFELGIAELWGGTLEPTTGQRVSILVKNTGDRAYNGKLALCLAKTEQDAQSIILAERSTLIAADREVSVPFDIDLTGKEEGDYKLYVAYHNGTRYKSIEELAGQLTVEKKTYKLSLYSTPTEFQGHLYEKLTISIQLHNSGKIDYNGSLGLYAVEHGSIAGSSAKQLIKGNARLEAAKNTTANFHPVLSGLNENKTYDLYLTYTNQAGTETWLADAKGQALAIGTLFIKEKSKPKPAPVAGAPVAIERVNIYQNGEYKGSSAPYVSYSGGRGKFSARVYLEPKRDFNGDIRLILKNPNGQTTSALDSKAVRRSIRIEKTTRNGYVDVAFTTAGFSDSYYYLGLQYYDASAARWVTTEDSFLFLVNYAAYAYGLDPNDKPENNSQPTQGKTYRIDPAKSVSIGEVPALDSDLDLSSSTTEVLEVLNQGYSLYPSVTRDAINLRAQEAGVASIYDLTGKLIQKVQMREGLNPLSVSNLPQGAYMIRINDAKLRFVKQ